jgi:ABC-type Fe3+/spermidine/putrescine transport system ATPase subunit
VTHDQEEALTLSDRVAVMRRGRIVQLGRPEELYERPVESFIAEFLGECNLLPVEACTLLADDRAKVTVFGQHSVVAACGKPSQDDAVLVVRPKQVQITPEAADFTLEARVVELLYLGEVVRMRFRMEEGIDLLARVDARRASRARIGDEVTLGFSADDVVLVPRTEPPTSEELEGRKAE